MYPSIPRIAQTLELEKVKAIEARMIMDGRLDPESYSSVASWVSRCLNRPRDIELKMEALNQVLGGFGVEAIQPDGAYVDSFWRDTVALYVNNGDTYKPTVLYNTCKANFRLTSWGDYVERNRI